MLLLLLLHTEYWGRVLGPSRRPDRRHGHRATRPGSERLGLQELLQHHLQLEVNRLQVVLLHASSSLLQELSLNLLEALDGNLSCRIFLHLRIFDELLKV